MSRKDTRKEGIIYSVLNVVNGNRYIGKTFQGIEKRKTQHLSSKHKSVLNFAFKKYGNECFYWSILFKDVVTNEELNNLEMFFIEYYQTFVAGYNMTKGGEGMLGRKKSDKERKRQSQIAKSYWTEEKKKAHSERIRKDNPIHKKGAKEKQIRSLKEGYASKRLIPYMLGKHHTEETKDAIKQMVQSRGGFKGEHNPRYINIPQEQQQNMVELYVDWEFTLSDIEQHFNNQYKPHKIKSILNGYGIDLVKGKRSKLKVLRNEKAVLQKYLKERLPITTIKNELNVSPEDIKYILRYNGIQIEKRKAKLKGTNNPNYKHGKYIKERTP